MPEPFLTAVNCPFNLLRSFKDVVHQSKWISPSFKPRMHVTVSVSQLACMRPVIGMHTCDYDRSAAHSAQWLELELIFGRILQHGNMRERREGSSVCVTYIVDQQKRSCMRV